MGKFELNAQSVFDISRNEAFSEVLTSFLYKNNSTEEVINNLVLNNEILFHDITVLKAVINRLKEDPLKVSSVNIHGKSIDQYEQLIDVMLGVPNDFRKQLIIEITEDYVSLRSRDFIKELKTLGFKTALDDINKSIELQTLLRDLISYEEQDLIDFVKLSCSKGIPFRKSDSSCQWQLDDFELNFDGIFVFENITTIKDAEFIWKAFPTALIQGYCFSRATDFITSEEITDNILI